MKFQNLENEIPSYFYEHKWPIIPDVNQTNIQTIHKCLKKELILMTERFNTKSKRYCYF